MRNAVKHITLKEMKEGRSVDCQHKKKEHSYAFNIIVAI